MPVAPDLRARLERGDRLVGTFLQVPSIVTAEVVGGLGVDFVCVEAEHSPMSREAVHALVAGASSGEGGSADVGHSGSSSTASVSSATRPAQDRFRGVLPCTIIVTLLRTYDSDVVRDNKRVACSCSNFDFSKLFKPIWVIGGKFNNERFCLKTCICTRVCPADRADG